MRNVVLLLLVVIAFESQVLAQEKQASKWNATLTGWVRVDYAFDSRQVEASRDGYYLLYPKPELKDPNGKDINDVANLNSWTMNSRVGIKINGPEIWGAKTSGLIETDFFGATEDSKCNLRIRHAYMEMKFDNTALLVGQYWHPLYGPEVAPGVAAANGGAPFQPFGRNPQIRITQNLSSDFKGVFTILTQRDYASYGPAGVSADYMRNALIPNLNFQLQYFHDKNLVGAGIDFKSLKPLLLTSANYSTDKTINSLSYWGYAKLATPEFIFQIKGIYGQNLSNLTMIGGYGVKSVDPTTKELEYSNLNLMSGWLDFTYNISSATNFGIFGGYVKNLGADDNISIVYGRGLNIDNILRVAPRVVTGSENLKLSGEIEYTAAAYGVPDLTDKYKVKNTTTVSNVRLQLGLVYSF